MNAYILFAKICFCCSGIETSLISNTFNNLQQIFFIGVWVDEESNFVLKKSIELMKPLIFLNTQTVVNRDFVAN